MNTHIKLVERRGGGVEKSQEGILGILVLDTYRHRTNNTIVDKYEILKTSKSDLHTGSHRTAAKQRRRFI